MLKHGLQGMDGTKIILPHNNNLRPNRTFLSNRFDLFRKAG